MCDPSARSCPFPACCTKHSRCSAAGVTLAVGALSGVHFSLLAFSSIFFPVDPLLLTQRLLAVTAGVHILVRILGLLLVSPAVQYFVK